MKKSITIFFILFLCKYSDAQISKLFDFVQANEDSSFTTYNFKVKFESSFDKAKRINLVKIELKNSHNISQDKIYNIESFIDKRPRIYRYRIKVAKK